jgi:hypothetical protein
MTSSAPASALRGISSGNARGHLRLLELARRWSIWHGIELFPPMIARQKWNLLSIVFLFGIASGWRNDSK